MKIKFAKDGLPSIAFLVVATAVLAFAFETKVPALIVGALTALTLWFYRDPDRIAPDREEVFISPADGRVVEIAEAEHPFTGPALKVGIFMNLFSVHVNRAPCTGRVDYLEYVPGKKIAAFAPKASEVNERHYVGLSTPHGPVMMVQIAGLVARRIVCRLARGDVLEAGQRYGMIRMGSRVDIYLPKEVTLTVNIGDKVYAGASCLGALE